MAIRLAFELVFLSSANSESTTTETSIYYGFCLRINHMHVIVTNTSQNCQHKLFYAHYRNKLCKYFPILRSRFNFKQKKNGRNVLLCLASKLVQDAMQAGNVMIFVVLCFWNASLMSIDCPWG